MTCPVLTVVNKKISLVRLPGLMSVECLYANLPRWQFSVVTASRFIHSRILVYDVTC